MALPARNAAQAGAPFGVCWSCFMLGSGSRSFQFCAGAKAVLRSAPIMGLYGGEHEAIFSPAGLRLARRLQRDALPPGAIGMAPFPVWWILPPPRQGTASTCCWCMACAPTAGVATAADGIELVERTIKLPQGELRIKALVWSPLTTPLNRQLDYDLSARLPATRAKLNAKAKDKLLDDCLPDALVYQGVARDTIQQRMAQAILRATGDAPCEFNAAQKQRRQIEPGGIQRPERPADLYAGTRTLCRPGSGCGECAGFERAGLVWPAGASRPRAHQLPAQPRRCPNGRVR